jgi:site-specific DNA recombinase
MRGILLCQNQYHARATASRVMQGEIHNVQKGDCAGGQPPYGLTIVNKQYEINEEEAPAIRLIFSMTAKRT